MTLGLQMNLKCSKREKVGVIFVLLLFGIAFFSGGLLENFKQNKLPEYNKVFGIIEQSRVTSSRGLNNTQNEGFYISGKLTSNNKPFIVRAHSYGSNQNKVSPHDFIKQNPVGKKVLLYQKDSVFFLSISMDKTTVYSFMGLGFCFVLIASIIFFFVKPTKNA